MKAKSSHVFYLPHDDIKKRADYERALLYHVNRGSVLGELPWQISPTVDNLEKAGARVRPLIILEDPYVVADRYHNREGVEIPQRILDRIPRMYELATKYREFCGTAKEVSDYLLHQVFR
jgi:hypothetical protein